MGGIQGFGGVWKRGGTIQPYTLVEGDRSDSHLHLTLHMPHFVDGTELPLTLTPWALILEEVEGVWYGLAIWRCHALTATVF